MKPCAFFNQQFIIYMPLLLLVYSLSARALAFESQTIANSPQPFAMVLAVMGNPALQRPWLKETYLVHPGDILHDEWILRGDSKTALTLLCENERTVTLLRNKSTADACTTTQRPKRSLIRFRYDEKDTRFPTLVRPRASKLLNLFPIQWHYNNPASVDVYLVTADTGERQLLKASISHNELHALGDIRPSTLALQSYYIDVCRAGSKRLCFHSSARQLQKPFILVGDKARTDIVSKLALKSADIAKYYGLNYHIVNAGLLFFREYYDDARSILREELDIKSDAEILTKQQLFYLAQTQQAVGLYSSALSSYKTVINPHPTNTRTPTSRSALIKQACDNINVILSVSSSSITIPTFCNAYKDLEQYP
ncbi:MAG: hypothetical protein MI976_01660 [Pseudomonadales bacterium]|nr:hypothetical protein [Pseudomonadales bacterium]